MSMLSAGFNGTDPGSGMSAQNQEMLAGAYGGSTPVPGLEDLYFQEFTPEQIQYMGDLNYQSLSPTELRKVLVDSHITDAQNKALQGYQDIYNQKGLTDIDRARLQEIQSQQQSIDRGQREAILQGQAQKGMLRGGATLASMLQSAQAGANQANQNALTVNAQAQQRALEALAQGGQMAGQMNDQQYAQRARAAQAQDAINQFNNQNMNDVARRNLELRQQLAASNVENLNNAQAQNIANRNQALYYNKVTKPLSIFDMESGNRQAAAQGISGSAQMRNSNTQAQRGRDTQLTGAGLQAGGTALGGWASGGFK